MPIIANPFKGRQYPGEVILRAVRCYLRYPLAYEHVAELLAERGLGVDATCVWRRNLYMTKPIYKVKDEDNYLYRLWIRWGRPLNFCALGQARRSQVFSLSANPIPRVINVDNNPAYPAVVGALKSGRYTSAPSPAASVQVSQQCC